MRNLFYFILITILLIGSIPLRAGRCTGSSNCTACSDCSSCQYCNSGGSCGVCASSQRFIDPQKDNKLKEAADKILQEGSYAGSLKQKADRIFSNGSAQTTTTHSGQATKSDLWVVLIAVVIILYFGYRKLN